MHRAPAVNFSVKRSRWHVRLIAGIGLLAIALLAVFTAGQTALDVRTALLTLAIFVSGGAALQGWRQSPQGNLRWDGQQWHWSGFASDPACRLGLLMDFQIAVVVTITAETQAPISLWLEARPGDACWTPLRRAIVSSQAESGGRNKKADPDVAGDLA